MKAHSARRKITSPIPASRWVAYTTAGAATALGCVASAEAAVTFVNVNEAFNAPPGGSDLHYFQLTAGHSFGLIHQRLSTYSGSSVGVSKFGIFGAGGAFVGKGSSFLYASKLALGANIAGAGFANGIIGTLAFGLGYPGSQWLTPGQGYVGFKFTDAGGQEYGWAKITANGTAADNTFTLNSYAYTTAGEVIKAGQTSVPAVPEPGSLALLAAGGAGLLAWRQRRAKSLAAQAL